MSNEYNSELLIFAGGTLAIHRLWTDERTGHRWQHAYRIVLCTGAVFGPLVIKPFISEYHVAFINHTWTLEGDISNSWMLHPNPVESRLPYAFVVVAAILFFFGLISFLLYFFRGGINFNPSHDITPQEQDDKHISVKRSVTVMLILVCILQALPLRVYSTFLLTFTVYQLKWAKTSGIYITTAFYVSLVVTKVITSMCQRQSHIEFMVFLGLALNVASSILYIFLIDYHPAAPWVFTVLLAAGTASTVSALVAWANKYISTRNNFIIVCCLSGSVGELIFSPVVGHIFLSFSPIYVQYLVSGGITLALVFMIIAQVLGVKCIRRSVGAVSDTSDANNDEKVPLLTGT